MPPKRSPRVSTKAPRRSSKKTARRRASVKPAIKAHATRNAVAGEAAAGHVVALRDLRAAYGMNREEFRRLSGFSVRSQANWESGEKTPNDAARLRLAEFRRLRNALAAVMRPATIAGWINTPNPAFQGLKPVEVVERGQIDRLWKMIHELESGVG